MVKFDIQVDIPSDVLAEPASRAEHILALQIKKDTTPFVPALTGSLSTRTRVEEGTVIYPGPYARYLYYGKLMVDPETGSSYATKGKSKVKTDKDLIFNQAMHVMAQSHWFEASKAQNLKKWIDVADKAVKDELNRK
ncbi:minor capsid protein [Muriventricola aceti]|uniref:minor capsid protein n=1 Tax=Muriventricola aceti TaxID=2981773 RepID=UPI0008208B22|nr:minor capsid protein [Muriventricola aceti]MCU6704239.1 minor capsid protein [Muriventricola aceti]SCJ72294.1 Minor capsid protein [uncultured Flavonifractor sp.]